MIVQRLRGTETEQIFIDQARLVIKESAITGSSMVIELDAAPNDPRYEKVEVELMGRVTFIEREKDAQSKRSPTCR